MRLSIIIPMYNAEAFIRKCLTSCRDQDIPAEDYEIIVVNDGSRDKSAGIVKDIAAGSTVPIHLLEQENSGQASARNRALEAAKGEYIWFVDADDWIKENCLGDLLALATNSDVLAFGMTNFTSDGAVESIFSYKYGGHCTGVEFICTKNEKLKLCPPTYLWRKDLLDKNDIRFYHGIVHEDAEFIPRAIYLAENINISTTVPYNRLLHPGSTTQTINSRRPVDLLTVADSLKSFADRNVSEQSAKKSFDSLISNILNYACKLSDMAPAESRPVFEKSLSALDFVQDTLNNSLQTKYRLEGFLLGLFPRKLPDIHRFLMRFNR